MVAFGLFMLRTSVPTERGAFLCRQRRIQGFGGSGSSLDGRKYRSTAVSMSAIHPSRISVLNERKERTDGEYVLYWMQSSVRSRFNHALEHAIETANRLKLPLITVYGIYEKFPEGNERSFAFVLQGLADVQKLLQKRDLTLTVVRQPEPPEAIVALSRSAAIVVVDRGYLRIQRQWKKALAKKCTCSVVQVESDVVVPVEVASQKEETAARTIRPKIEGNRAQFLKPLEPGEITKKMQSKEVNLFLDRHDLQELDVQDTKQALAGLDVDRTVKPVETFLGGETEAQKHLKIFLEERLPRYGNRNEPSMDVTSDMSPYLHFGHISPIDIAMEAEKKRRKLSQEVASFLEELIVRRELSINMCYYNDEYDTIEILPNYAKITLKEHAKDKRPYVYTEEQLEQGKTHDAYWNAAQLEMVLTGKMHTYMRMYWGKKILEWTSNPKLAFNIALRQNNKYQLDGRDPNSFTGIAWCFGKHDQGWAERAVFGKVRYMNDKGLERKFDMKGYLQKVNRIKSESGKSTGKSDLTAFFEKRLREETKKKKTTGDPPTKRSSTKRRK